MELSRKEKIILKTILVGRRLVKTFRIEDNKFILMIHSFLLKFFRPESPSIEVNGHRLLLGNDSSMLPGLLNNTYEVHELNFVRRNLKPGDVFVDVGANVGLYSLLAASIVGEKGKVLSFEPSKKTFSLLKKNLQGFSNCTLINEGISDEDTILELNYSPDTPGCSSFETKDGDAKESVRVKPLDDHLRDLQVGRPNFIKIDIEGHEDKALNGMVEAIGQETIILCEFNPAFLRSIGKSPEDMLETLKKRFKQVSYISESNGDLRHLQKVTDLDGQLIANVVLRCFT